MLKSLELLTDFQKAEQLGLVVVVEVQEEKMKEQMEVVIGGEEKRARENIEVRFGMSRGRGSILSF